MKFPNKARWFASALILAAASSLGFAAPKIGVLLKAKNSFWDSLIAGANTAGTAAGAELIIKAPNAETDLAIQYKLLEILSKQNIDALVVCPINQDNLSKPLADLAAKGVKIVSVDTSAGEAYPFVGTNQKAAGEGAGKYLATLIQDGDEVAILRNNQQSKATADRESGAIAKLQEAKPGIKLHSEIYAGSEAGLEAEKAALVLSKYPNIKAVFSSSTPGTMAMLHELEKKGLAGKVKFVGCGFDLNDEIVKALEEGKMNAWVAQLPGQMGSKSIETAAALIAGKQVPSRVETDFKIITKEDLKDPKVMALKH